LIKCPKFSFFASAAMPAYKVTYFPITALGEPIRATLALAGIPFEDERVPGEEWGKRKSDPASPFFGQQMPALTITADDSSQQVLFQSKSILRYVGKIGKYDGKALYPEDPMAAYWCDMVIDMVEDIRPLMIPSFAIADQAEKEAARLALVTAPDGKMLAPLKKLDEQLAKSPFAAGDSVSIADLYVVIVCHLFQQPSFLDGFPADTFKAFPNITALKDRVMALPPLKDYYKDADGIRAPFKVA